MADDANFHGGRLRLTAFLRVVENAMPPRPSRFKRRMPLAENPSQEPSLQEPFSAKTTPDVLNAPVRRPSFGADTEVLPEVFPHTGLEFDIPRSPTPTHADPSLDSNEHSDVARNKQAAARAIKQARADGEAVHILKAKPAYDGRQRPSGTRRRRLPVNGLALLRTTTLDALPEPSDACKALALSITDFDPIDDGELVSSFHDRRPRAQCSQHPVQTVFSTIGHGPTSRGPCSVKQDKSSISKSQSRSIPVKSKQYTRTGLHFVADGFVGSELKLGLTRKSRQRVKAVPRQTKPKLVITRLALVSGLLPTPVAQNAEMTGFPWNATAEAPYEPVEVAGVPEQLDLISARSAIHGRQTQIEQAAQWEHTLRSQLLSITAPPRQDSESSQSDVVMEGQSVADGEEKHEAEEPEEIVHSQQPSLLSCRSTVTEDHGYFESGMYHLDIVQTTESDDEGVWPHDNVVE